MNHASVVFRRVLLAGSLAGAALALSACGEHRGMNSLKTPVVAMQTATRDIAFGPDHRINPADAQALRAFLVGLRPDYGTRLMLDDPHAEGAAARRAAIASIVAETGVTLSDTPPPARTELPVGIARLWIVRGQAQPPACPDWSSNPSANMTAANHSNYGCAVNGNFAAMVADPADLTDGRPYDGASGADIAKDQDFWRRRQPTGFQQELAPTSTTSGGGGGGGGGSGGS